MTEYPRCEIDYSPKCRGVWFDRGELDKIIEGADGPTPPRTSGRSYETQGGYGSGERYDFRPKRKKKSMLGELFDF